MSVAYEHLWTVEIDVDPKIFDHPNFEQFQPSVTAHYSVDLNDIDFQRTKTDQITISTYGYGKSPRIAKKYVEFIEDIFEDLFEETDSLKAVKLWFKDASFEDEYACEGHAELVKSEGIAVSRVLEEGGLTSSYYIENFAFNDEELLKQRVGEESAEALLKSAQRENKIFQENLNRTLEAEAKKLDNPQP